MSTDPLVIISCGGQKKPGGPWPAASLYTGVYFRTLLKAALVLTRQDRVLILSGKWGLCPLGRPLHSYDQRIDQPGAVTLAEALDLLSADPVILLAGKHYASVSLPIWPTARTPLVSSPPAPMGVQMSFLSRAITIPDPLSFFLNPETSVHTPIPGGTGRWLL